jgi:hypothetical protein
MCLSADEANPLCDECLAKWKQASKEGGEVKDEDMCDECRDLPNHYCFCCDIDQRLCEEDLDIVEGVCKTCRDM